MPPNSNLRSDMPYNARNQYDPTDGVAICAIQHPILKCERGGDKPKQGNEKDSRRNCQLNFLSLAG